jgi:hypothetical protein
LLITLAQWLQNSELNDLGKFFKTAASFARHKKQSASVADLDSKVSTAFLKGFKTNERIRKFEKKLRD